LLLALDEEMATQFAMMGDMALLAHRLVAELDEDSFEDEDEVVIPNDAGRQVGNAAATESVETSRSASLETVGKCTRPAVAEPSTTVDSAAVNAASDVGHLAADDEDLESADVEFVSAAQPIPQLHPQPQFFAQPQLESPRSDHHEWKERLRDQAPLARKECGQSFPASSERHQEQVPFLQKQPEQPLPPSMGQTQEQAPMWGKQSGQVTSSSSELSEEQVPVLEKQPGQPLSPSSVGSSSRGELEPLLAPQPKGRSEPGQEPRPESRPAAAVSDAAIPENGSRQDGPWHRWSEAELPTISPRENQVVRVFCAVWNLHGKQAPADLSPWITLRPKHHIYVVGTAECERSIEKSMVYASKARWERQVANHLGDEYIMVGAHNMSAIHNMVFVHRYLWRYCWNIKTAQVATGFANFVGNKGGTQVGFNLGHTSILCVNAHLAAHAGKMKERTQNLTRILADSPMRREKNRSGIHEEYDRVFFMGDLNARVDATRQDVDLWLEEQQLGKCLERDQLLPLLRADPESAAGSGPAGMWPAFEEAPIRFLPTYKYDSHSDRYDSSKKKRVPSWTDRILWKRDAHITSLAYGSIQSLQCSDHKPIFAQFEVAVNLDSWTGPETPEPKGGDSRVCTIS